MKASLHMPPLSPIERFESSTGARIYRIPAMVFPGFSGCCHVVLHHGQATLIDTGSGFGSSNDDLLAGIAAIKSDFGEKLDVGDIGRVIITHGHIDHFGGLGFILEQAPNAQIGIHELDRRVLTNYDERIIVATRDMRVYLERAGVKPSLRDNLLSMYAFAKKNLRAFTVDFNLDEGTVLDDMEFFHVPGHSPGQVCIRIGDILLSADHVLSKTTPHQAPESITPYTGLGHYRDSLKKASRIEGIRLALGGHEGPIHDFYARIDEILSSHERKLNRVLEILCADCDPMTISEISKIMYPNKGGYEILLALEGVGAHIEYLYQRGYLAVCNLDEVETESNPPLRYRPA